MATNIGSMDNTYRLKAAPYAPRIYLANDYDPIKVWDGVWSQIVEAGIPAPTSAIGSPDTTASGDVEAGTRLVRYRYRDSKSPEGRYVSDPSDALSVTTTAAATFEFTVGTAGSGMDIIRSTDSKVDTIILESTVAAGTTYYEVTTVDNSSDTSLDYDLSDDLLVQNTLAQGFGNEQPPTVANMFESAGYMWACGSWPWSFTCSFTNGSATVTATGISDEWVGRLIRRDGDTQSYEIQAITQGSPDSMTLTEDYAGTTGSGTARIYPSNPNRVYWSAKFLPESWYISSRAIDVLGGTGDRLVGGIDYRGQPWVFGQTHTSAIVFDDQSGPENGREVGLSSELGLWNAACVVKPDENTVLGWCSAGVWRVYGGRPQLISRAVNDTWRDDVDYTKYAQFAAFYDPENQVAYFMYVATGDSEPHDGLMYDMRNDLWGTVKFRNGIDAVIQARDANGRSRAVLSDSTNGRTWWFGGATDGVVSTFSGYITADSGSTTTVTNVTQSLPTGTPDLTDLYIYRPSTGEEKVVSSNTSSTVTHGAFSTAVASGEELYVGSIPVIYETSWWVGQGQDRTKRPDYLHLAFNPSSTGTMRVKIYLDHQSSAHIWSKKFGEIFPDGVTVVDGRDYAVVDFDGGGGEGYISMQMPADWSNSIKARFEVDDPRGTMRVTQAWFDQKLTFSSDGE